MDASHFRVGSPAQRLHSPEGGSPRMSPWQPGGGEPPYSQADHTLPGVTIMPPPCPTTAPAVPWPYVPRTGILEFGSKPITVHLFRRMGVAPAARNQRPMWTTLIVTHPGNSLVYRHWIDRIVSSLSMKAMIRIGRRTSDTPAGPPRRSSESAAPSRAGILSPSILAPG